DLVAAVPQEAGLAKSGVVPADLHHRRLAAGPALHRAPPEITGRTSTVEPSTRTASPVTRVPSTMTSTDSRLRSNRSSRVCTPSGPATSSSRRGLRNTTFTVLL